MIKIDSFNILSQPTICLLRELSFFTGRGGASVCDRRSSIFSGPPLSIRKKILVPPPLWPLGKILAPKVKEHPP